MTAISGSSGGITWFSFSSRVTIKSAFFQILNHFEADKAAPDYYRVLWFRNGIDSGK